MAYYQWRAQSAGDLATPWLHCASCARHILRLVKKLRKRRR